MTPTTLSQSPTSSIYKHHSLDITPSPSPSTPTVVPVRQGPQPTILLLFSLISRRNLLLFTLPAVLASLISGAIAPYMTVVVGRSFDAFAQFPLLDPSKDDKARLLHGVGIAALELLCLAAGALALSSITSCLWIWTGEHNTVALRTLVYDAVTRKDMAWFDARMGSDATALTPEGEHAPLGAGGLMATFSRETEEVRMASSLASGLLLQYLTTCIACLALAFQRSWSLTLVILSAVPALVLIQGLSQTFAGPLLAKEREDLATAASLLDRAVAAIATVKAFNATQHEHGAFSTVLARLHATVKRISAIWGASSGLAQFATMGMFVQGFWFGAKLVRSGTLGAGDVMAVFWACLIATSSLQMCIPQLIVLAKGKFAMASLLTLVEGSPSPGPAAPTKSRKPVHIRKIVPLKCSGELAMHNVTFAYPSRPTVPVLQDVSLFLPAHETTFIVGGSGSGKSTVAQLLLRMYDAQSGTLQLDNQDMAYLDDAWMREHVACVSQECILFDMSVHDNVAMGLAGSGDGRQPKDVTHEEVVEACRAALMHDFVRDLPEGYLTQLGNGGASLSGGQMQRLAIARAKLRNPTVLILDEATSALDATSRVLVFEAIKRWRANKTTVVITHDLSQITSHDFVYVLKNGSVVEQGYRYDLETSDGGAFREMMVAQATTGGHLPEKMDIKREKEVVLQDVGAVQRKTRGDSRPLTWGKWIFEPITDFSNGNTSADRLSRLVLPPPSEGKRQSNIHVTAPQHPPPAHTAVATRRLSSPFRPISAFSFYSPSMILPGDYWISDDPEFDAEKSALQRSGSEASRRRPDTPKSRARWDDSRLMRTTTITVENPQTDVDARNSEKQQSFWSLVRDIYPTVPCKLLVLFGLVACLLNGVMTPVFSFLLSRLIFAVSTGATDTSTINTFGGIVLSVAALDGIFLGIKYFILETAATRWVTHIRKVCFKLVLAQDKRWFDKSENSAVRLVQVLVKDGDDAANLISVVLGQCCVVAAMLSVGLIWALVKGWQLTLVGFAFAPVFAATMAFQTNLVAKCELRSKRATEEVSKSYYEALSNIRAIRSMAFESVFRSQFSLAAEQALAKGVRGALVEGSTHGVASALIYVAEAMLFYVGATLVARGTYTYLQMVEVLNLVVFTVTIGSQLLSCTQKIAKSVQATRDFNGLLKLSTDTDESKGIVRPPATGAVTFNKVSFSYPERPDAPVLKNLSMHVTDGECVAIVGSSGSGKSTIAALLQRLYEPDSGGIYIGHSELRTTKVHHLREHVAVVSQHPNLFDVTISANIAYGSESLSDYNIRRAAKAANVDEFIKSLPEGYDTMVGENASLISGGQAQRLQIARALARPSMILILDECTSSLDPSNQAAVLETIQRAKVGRTTIMVTHKLPVMQMCDRILVVHDGRVAEDGTYDELMRRKGVFRSLANAGEWLGE